MSKNFFKELIISLLLCLAIILLLGVLLYEYVPMNKTVPNAVTYTTPEEARKELNEKTASEESIATYETIDSNDLNNYKRIQSYKPGKSNPFSTFDVTSTEGQTAQPSGSGNSSGENTNNENTTSGGTFFQNKGTK